MKITFSKPGLPAKGALVVGVYEGKKLTAGASELDRKTRGAIARAIAGSRFVGKSRQLLSILAPAGIEAERVVLLGLGKAKGETKPVDAEALGGALVGELGASGAREAAVAIDLAGEEGGVSAAHFALGAKLRSYRFDKYRTKEKPEDKPTLQRMTIHVEASRTAQRAYGELEQVAEAVFFARDLVSEPANVVFPKSLANQCRSLAALGVKVEVLGIKEMTRLGMGALLGVGQGSAHESQLVVMQWQGKPSSKDKPLAFIGKGVTFDTGGISLKPALGMEDMKWDMGGSAAVIGLMRAVAGRKAKANVVGIVGLVENMPSGTAQRPGDVVKSMSGQTIEITNTDAEGRLVLADALWYCQDRFKPRFMVDLATLTGAIVIALGHEFAGAFVTDDELADRLLASAKATGEGLWRMPLAESYDRGMDSDIADVKNSGARDGGSCKAAMFMKRFTNDVPWAHLDIAGMAWSSKDKPVTPKGATAYGVRLLDHLVKAYYEKS
ncbi:MAG: leucyl aminopeptidase [Alphaproteobacteria bacterium]|nr:leucyl aminopeptidase [Alphaproteobacteria bacterium]